MASWNEKLIKAVVERNLPDLKLSIENGAELEYRSKGFTALLIAVQTGYLELVQFLITAGCDRESRTKYDFTPLLVAVQQGYLEIVKYLIKANCNKETRTKDGNTPLIKAVKKGNLQIVQYLISVGCERDSIGNNGFTPLLFAVQEGHLEIAEFLVKAGCDIESKTKKGNTPLFIAVENGNLQIVQYLITVGCQRDARDNDSFTPLLYAVQKGYIEIVKFLVTAQCDIESKTKMGLTPLLVAAFKGHMSIVLYLITVGCIRETRSKDGRTALHFAAQFGNLQVTKVLIEEVGISPFEKTYQGKTPYQLAAETNRQDSTEKRQEKDEIMDFLKTVMLTEEQKVISKLPQQQGILQVLQERIIQDIQISQVLDYMMSHLVISSDDRRRIEHYAGQDEQNKALLGVVNKRGEPTYSVFVDALRTNGYTDLANELECDSQEEGSSSALVYTGDTDNKGLSNWTVPVFKIRLQKNYSNIINSILHGKIVDHLISRDVLSTADSERIDACPAKIEKIRKLMDILLHGSENGFIEFLNALREDSEYTELAGEIENTTVSSRDISTMQSCFK